MKKTVDYEKYGEILEMLEKKFNKAGIYGM